MISMLTALLSREYASDIGYYGEKTPFYQELLLWCESKGITLHALKDLSVSRWPQGGEFYGALITTDDFWSNMQMSRALYKGLHKNHHLYMLFVKTEKRKLSEILESHGFRDFSAIDEAGETLYISKKWFNI